MQKISSRALGKGFLIIFSFMINGLTLVSCLIKKDTRVGKVLRVLPSGRSTTSPDPPTYRRDQVMIKMELKI